MKKAIIVDDSEIARKILKKCCESMGFELVLVSASPKAVIQMLNDLKGDDEVPDLILCDIMMPEMDGYEMIKKIQLDPRYQDIKAIAVTSAVHVGSARSAQESGFNGFLPKPVFLDELAKIITTVLGDKRDDKTIVTRHMAEELKFRGSKVLILEKKELDRKIIKECLSSMECEYGFVSTGHEAIECLKEGIYDLCLLDFHLFEEEGVEIVRIMKEVSGNMPTIMLISPDDEKDRKECLNAGVDDFLIKPVDMAGLKRVIKRYGEQ